MVPGWSPTSWLRSRVRGRTDLRIGPVACLTRPGPGPRGQAVFCLLSGLEAAAGYHFDTDQGAFQMEPGVIAIWDPRCYSSTAFAVS